MKILMILTSHDQLGNTGRKRRASGSKSSRLPTSFSRMLGLRLRSHPRKAVVPR